jgi:hypothetical protein
VLEPHSSPLKILFLMTKFMHCAFGERKEFLDLVEDYDEEVRE